MALTYMAVWQLVYDLQAACAWHLFDANIGTLIDVVQAQIEDKQVPIVAPFHSVHYPMTRQMVADIARLHADQRYQEILDKAGADEDYTIWDPKLLAFPEGRPQRLRIGYVSADFVNHPTADLMQSALLLHDQSRFEIFLYSISRDDTSMYRQVLKREISNFKALPNKASDKKCAE
ncbi:glycosyl transferase family 41-domain-containing protein, partial [Baffinella frigidus]